MKQFLKHLLISVIVFALSLTMLNGCQSSVQTETTTETAGEKTDTTKTKQDTITEPRKHCTLYASLKNSYFLKDPNRMHIITGREVGLKEPFRKNADFLAVRDSLLENNILQYVEEGEHYVKKPMHYSYPYLTSDAVSLLNEICDRFHEKLEKKKLNSYSIILTSCLRTLESQNTLRSSNLNATRDTTSHAFGASFDISYWEFYNNKTGQTVRYKNLQKILHQTIKEIRNEKKCLVIKETGQFCFHCTVIY